MSEYLSDKEQIEAFKNWWKEYGQTIAIAVVIGLGVGFGWRYWSQWQMQKEATASAMYQGALMADEKADATQAATNADELAKKFPSSPYSALASFLVAKDAVAHNNLDLAVEKFKWVIAHARDHRFQQIARIRAARIMLEQKQYPQALSVLSTVNDKTFLPMIQQVRGDIYAAQGRQAEAQKEYDAAKKALQSAGVQDPLLQMKIAG
jgi:predicted negative regulator of RcsB-dependent stress response